MALFFEDIVLPDAILIEHIIPKLDSFDVLRLVVTCKAFRDFQRRTGIQLRTKISDVLRGSWTSILWAKSWCEEFPWSPKLIEVSARVSNVRVVQLLIKIFDIQRPPLGIIGYEAAQVVNSSVLVWALQKIPSTTDVHKMLKTFFALICFEILGSRGRLDILSMVYGNDISDDSQVDDGLALELWRIVSDNSVYRRQNPIFPSWFYGMEPVLPMFGEDFRYPWMLAVAKGAVENARLDILTWLWEKGFEFHKVRRLCHWAGKSGDRDIITWVRSHSGVPWNEVAVCKGLTMVTSNYLTFRPVEMIQWVLNPQTVNLENSHALLSVFESAARYGRKDVLKWGSQRGLELCGCLLLASVSKVDEGAENVPGIYEGKLSVLNWLVRRNCPFVRRCPNGQLLGMPDVLKEMLYRSIENPSIILARRVRDIGEALNFKIFLSQDYYSKAASKDYVEVFDVLPPFIKMDDREEYWIKVVGLEACKNGSLRIIKWFARKFRTDEMTQIFKYAEEYKQTAIVNFLRKNNIISSPMI